MPELAWDERHLVGFENRLKDESRDKDKVAESLAVKGRTVDEAMKLIPDAIRYAFQHHEADYGRHLPADIALTEERYADLPGRKHHSSFGSMVFIACQAGRPLTWSRGRPSHCDRDSLRLS